MNLRMGLQRARELGAEPRVGYLPDQFGHIGQMPRILREGGLGWALVWRGVPAAIDRSTFRWRSTDGAAGGAVRVHAVRLLRGRRADAGRRATGAGPDDRKRRSSGCGRSSSTTACC